MLNWPHLGHALEVPQQQQQRLAALVKLDGGAALRVAVQEPHAGLHAWVLAREGLEGKEALALAGIAERRRRTLELQHVLRVLLRKACV